MSTEDEILLSIEGKIAIITLNIPKKLNALTQDLYFKLSQTLRQVAKTESVYITILTGKGRYFSAGADVSLARPTPSPTNPSAIYRSTLQSFVANNLNTTRAFATHPKILVTALNGPVIGLSAALISHSDFIYATPQAFLLTPFTSLGLVAEGGSSVSFVERLGISRANEALIMSRRIGAEEMLTCGFVNRVVETGRDDGDEGAFLGEVVREVKERLGEHLNADSLLKVKALIRRPGRERMEAQNAAEVFEGLERFVEGVPQEEFRKIASGEKRHKL
ncbi:hypothetical protein MMC21_004795 [Puttea exsequens]|nr:hypothetical protein [Puttea exsequens]